MGTDTLLTTSQIIRKRRMAVETRRAYISLLIRIVMLAAACWPAFSHRYF